VSELLPKRCEVLGDNKTTAKEACKKSCDSCESEVPANADKGSTAEEPSAAPSDKKAVDDAAVEVPSAAPCADDASWHKKGDTKKNCQWVSEHLPKRCDVVGRDKKTAKEACKKSCDSCESEPPAKADKGSTAEEPSAAPSDKKESNTGGKVAKDAAATDAAANAAKGDTAKVAKAAKDAVAKGGTATVAKAAKDAVAKGGTAKVAKAAKDAVAKGGTAKGTAAKGTADKGTAAKGSTTSEDDPAWHKRDDPSKDCAWVATHVPARCAVKGEDKSTACDSCPAACAGHCDA
jgi:hypothetical protein